MYMMGDFQALEVVVEVEPGHCWMQMRMEVVTESYWKDDMV